MLFLSTLQPQVYKVGLYYYALQNAVQSITADKGMLAVARPVLVPSPSIDCIEDNAITTIILPNLWCRPTT